MKQYPRFSNVLAFSFLLIGSMLVFVSCEEEVLELENSSDEPTTVESLRFDVANLANLETDSRQAQAAPFKVVVETFRCRRTATGEDVLAKVVYDASEVDLIDKSKPRYYFKWEVDGKDAGIGPFQRCVCGKSATVTVIRLSDGVRVQKTVKLNSICHDAGPTVLKQTYHLDQ